MHTPFRAPAVALIGCLAAAAVGAQTNPNLRDPTQIRPPTAQSQLERDGLKLQAPPVDPGRRELFTANGLQFSFIDPLGQAQFVRQIDGGLREAQVKVVGQQKTWQFLLRGDCRAAQMYFGPPAAQVTLKPVEAGSVGATLYEDLCAPTGG